jgi:hypothetical protein
VIVACRIKPLLLRRSKRVSLIVKSEMGGQAGLDAGQRALPDASMGGNIDRLCCTAE